MFGQNDKMEWVNLTLMYLIKHRDGLKRKSINVAILLFINRMQIVNKIRLILQIKEI